MSSNSEGPENVERALYMISVALGLVNQISEEEHGGNQARLSRAQNCLDTARTELINHHNEIEDSS